MIIIVTKTILMESDINNNNNNNNNNNSNNNNINKSRKIININLKHFHRFCLSARNALQNVHI